MFRFLDGGDLDEEDKVKFLKIEETIFLSIKKDILEELGDDEWVGSSEQQSLADFKVAICLKKSFAEYEKNKAKSSLKEEEAAAARRVKAGRQKNR